MAFREAPLIRRASAGDTLDIARLHADSWRRHYRGAYSAFYLDGDLDADRLTVWTERLSSQETAMTFVAEESGAVVGFVHVQLDADPDWGALVDNLHVSYEWQGAGIGTRLLGAAALGVRELRPGAGIYLWVLEQNTQAQGFYLSRGGRSEGREPVSPPGGDFRNLVGQPYGIRVAWRDLSALTRF
jgi:ribosomal protein S18 acetylase RimI-like enzyme